MIWCGVVWCGVTAVLTAALTAGSPHIHRTAPNHRILLHFHRPHEKHLHLGLKEIASVDDLKLTITSRMFMYMKWIDERIIFNMSDKNDLAILVSMSVV